MSSQGGILTFVYIRRLWLFFGVQNFEFQYFLGFSKKIFFLGGGGGGYEDFVDNILGCHRKIGLYLGVISMHFRFFFFLRARYRMWDIFWGS